MGNILGSFVPIKAGLTKWTLIKPNFTVDTTCASPQNARALEKTKLPKKSNINVFVDQLIKGKELLT